MQYLGHVYTKKGLPHSSIGKESAYNAGNPDLIPGWGRSTGEGKGYPLQYTGLESCMECIVHRVAKSRTPLSEFHYTKKNYVVYRRIIFNWASCVLKVGLGSF